MDSPSVGTAHRQGSGAHRLRWWLAVASLLAGLAIPSVGVAEQGGGGESSERHSPRLQQEYQPRGEALTSKREAPNTDALPEPGRDVGDVFLVIPRGILFPVYLTTNYLIRWPIGKLVYAVESSRFYQRFQSFLAFGEGNAGVLPIIELGGERAASFGLQVYSNRLFDGRLDAQLGAQGYPGRNYIVETNLDLRVPDDKSVLEFSAFARQRDDYAFFGVGRALGDLEDSRFTQRSLGGSVGWSGASETAIGGGTIALDMTHRRVSCSADLREDVCGEDGRFGTSDDRFAVTRPDVASLQTDYTYAKLVANATIDSRRLERETITRLRAGYDPALFPDDQTGLRAEGFVGVGTALSADLRSLHAGGELSAFVEIPGTHQRVFGLRVRTELADPFRGGQIPVWELASLGGVETFRGFLEHRFRGRSSLVATLNYRYPVWSFGDGELFVETGEIAGPHWRDFSFGRLRGSAGIGLRSRGLLADKEAYYALYLAAGTSPLQQTFAIEEVRLVFGTNWGF